MSVSDTINNKSALYRINNMSSSDISYMSASDTTNNVIHMKSTGLKASILTLFISLFMFISFYFSTNQFQFVQNEEEITFFNIYLGVDGLSMYFILLTTIIMPISLLSN